VLNDWALDESDRVTRVFASLERFVSPPPLMVVLSGPAGVGKDSVLGGLRERGVPFHFVVTTTARDPRPGEVDGVDYHFVTPEAFERLVREGALLEHALPYGQQKGVTKAEVRRALSSGLDAIMRLDVQGAASIRRDYPQAVSIFLAPPSREALARRLRDRGYDSEEQLQERLQACLGEIDRVAEFDYVVVNHEDRLDEAVDQVAAILVAEHCRTSRGAVDL